MHLLVCKSLVAQKQKAEKEFLQSSKKISRTSEVRNLEILQKFEFMNDSEESECFENSSMQNSGMVNKNSTRKTCENTFWEMSLVQHGLVVLRLQNV